MTRMRHLRRAIVVSRCRGAIGACARCCRTRERARDSHLSRAPQTGCLLHNGGLGMLGGLSCFLFRHVCLVSRCGAFKRCLRTIEAARRPYLTAICLALAASFVAESASHLLVLADHRFQGLQIDKPDHALIDIDQPL